MKEIGALIQVGLVIITSPILLCVAVLDALTGDDLLSFVVNDIYGQFK